MGKLWWLFNKKAWGISAICALGADGVSPSEKWKWIRYAQHVSLIQHVAT